MNNEWESICFLGQKNILSSEKNSTKPAARKTVWDLSLNAVDFYRFLITYHNSYMNVAPTHAFFIQNKFHRSLIFHYFIRFNNVGKRQNEERNVCHVWKQCFVLHMQVRLREVSTENVSAPKLITNLNAEKIWKHVGIFAR